MLNLNNINKIFISGIGGIGTSGLARMLKSLGKEVLGSDAVASEITDELQKEGVKIFIGQKADNVPENCDLFIYSAAVPEGNSERRRANTLELEQMNYFEALGFLTQNKKVIAVAGTNGKSSTTGMIAKCMIAANMDPSVIMGSVFPDTQQNYIYGKSDLFVAEACEYREHFLHLSPWAVVLTNIEEEHLDYFKDLEHVLSAYQKLLDKLSSHGLLVYNKDDINISKLNLPNCKKISFGASPEADLQIKNLRIENEWQKFSIGLHGRDLGDFEMQMPGKFNVYNASATIAFCLAMDAPFGVLKKCLQDYTGIWRRYEIIKDEDVKIISDYAHHPTSVQGTIEAIKQLYPLRRLVVVFQPHQHDRTQKLFSNFVMSLRDADVLIVPKIFDVVGREETGLEASSESLAKAVRDKFSKHEVFYTEDLDKTIEKVNSIMKKDDIILVMGAGDVYKICKSLG